jgi:hypothetical protein
MSLSGKRGEQESVYESFSDLLLGITVLLIALVAILAINVSLKSDTAIKSLIYNNRFTGGVERPKLFLSAYAYSYAGAETEQAIEKSKIYGDSQLIIFLMQSPTLATTYTTLDAEGNTVSSTTGTSFGGLTGLEMHEFLEMCAGIDPGSFKADGEETALLQLNFGFKTLLLSRINQQLSPSNAFSRQVCTEAWPVMEDMNPNVRSHVEYKDSVLHLYFESEIAEDGSHHIWIGDKRFNVPSQIINGELDFLVGLSSANTQFVYLGDYSIGDEKTNKRIDFFEQNSFSDAANDYKSFYYTRWENEHRELERRNIYSGEKESVRREIRRDIAYMKAASAIINGEPIPDDALHPLLKNRDAWYAYVESYTLQDSEVPQWVFDEFLNPLGFNKRVPHNVNIQEGASDNSPDIEDETEEADNPAGEVVL